MMQEESDFIALKILNERINDDPDNAGWYMHNAYQLGKGCPVDEALKLPPKNKPEFKLKLVNVEEKAEL